MCIRKIRGLLFCLFFLSFFRNILPLSCRFLSCPCLLPCFVVSCLVLVLFCFDLSCLVLFCFVSSCCVLSWLVLSCLPLSLFSSRFVFRCFVFVLFRLVSTCIVLAWLVLSWHGYPINIQFISDTVQRCLATIDAIMFGSYVHFFLSFYVPP